MLGWGSWMELHGFVELARLRHDLGDEAGVRDILQRMSRLGPQHAACAEGMEALFILRKSPHDPQARALAEGWTKRYRPDPSYPFSLGIGPYHRDAEYFCNLSWAQVQIALGHYQEASLFVDPALQSARETNLLYRVVELSVARALIYEGQGNIPAAMKELQRALEIAEPCEYMRCFDDGPETVRLLQQAVEKNIRASYVRKVLAFVQSMRARRGNESSVTTLEDRHAGQTDLLSERELEVLRLLATGQSPAQVARDLFLSPYTLKAHTQNIYTKLDVHSRVEAINKARELNLL
jgi:ATP/maltotriose-dependent transcriptional regulator MalT